MQMRSNSSHGHLVAEFLTKSWTTSLQTKPDISDSEFEKITPLLYESGAAALGWWRVRNTELRGTPSAELLHQAFRLLVLRARTHETRTERLFRLFRQASIDVILVKGWAIARCYPEQALRPYGDIDLLVRPLDFDRAWRILQSEDARDCFTDLNPRMFELDDRSIEDLFSRSQLLRCAEENVRVLAVEDHFALLSIHLLKHGAWRPLWLCDLGLLLDGMSSDFDWDLCLGKDKRRRNWILSAVGLARALLDASINDEAIGAQANAPPWLVEGVLKNWETPFAGSHAPHHHRAPIKSYLRRPRGIIGDLTRRWPDPILATISANGMFAHRRRVRYQIQNCVQRAARLLLPGTEPA